MTHKVFSLDQFYSFSCSQIFGVREDKKLITVLKKELDKKAERLLHMNIIVKEIIAKNRLTQ